MGNLSKEKIRRTILYYPTIKLPQDTWIRQVLLFWDEIASIVPYHYDYDQQKDVPVIPFSPEAKLLLNEKAFRPIDPKDLFRLNHPLEQVDQLAEEIQRLINSTRFNNIIGPRKNWILKSEVHQNKVSKEVFKEFEEKGLAVKKDDEWYLFETGTSLLYMSLLAKFLADIDPEHMMPGTNLKIYESLVFDAPSLRDGFACLDVRYSSSLPIPKKDISLSAILEFKKRKKNRTALLRFRSKLDEFHDSLSKVDKFKQLNQITVAFKEDIENGIAELAENLHDEKIETISGCFKTLVNVKSPAFWETIVASVSKSTNLAEIPVEWALLGIGISGTIQIGHHIIHRNNKRRAMLRESDFAYLYHAERAGIICNRLQK